MIEDSEVTVNGRLVKRISVPQIKVGQKYTSGKLAVSLKNRTDGSLKPSMKFSVYNPYGMLLGEFHVIHTIFSMVRVDAGDSYNENVEGLMASVRYVFEYSSVSVPDDIDTAAYIVVIDMTEYLDRNGKVDSVIPAEKIAGSQSTPGGSAPPTVAGTVGQRLLEGRRHIEFLRQGQQVAAVGWRLNPSSSDSKSAPDIGRQVAETEVHRRG